MIYSVQQETQWGDNATIIRCQNEKDALAFAESYPLLRGSAIRVFRCDPVRLDTVEVFCRRDETVPGEAKCLMPWEKKALEAGWAPPAARAKELGVALAKRGGL